MINTHHHRDHTGGNEELKRRHGYVVVGPKHEVKGAIPGVDISVTEGDVVTVGNMRAVVMETPGHTAGHVVYHFPVERKVFVGDTLCHGLRATLRGRRRHDVELHPENHGPAEETEVYCAHEYTLTNARFAATVEPENAALIARLAEVERRERLESRRCPRR